jgi:hypothetical protein
MEINNKISFAISAVLVTILIYNDVFDLQYIGYFSTFILLSIIIEKIIKFIKAYDSSL